jgi:hypothetical protein
MSNCQFTQDWSQQAFIAAKNLLTRCSFRKVVGKHVKDEWNEPAWVAMLKSSSLSVITEEEEARLSKKQ